MYRYIYIFYIYKQCPLKIKLVFLKLKTSEEHSDHGKKMEKKKKRKTSTAWGCGGRRIEHDSEGKCRAFKVFIMAYSGSRTSCVCTVLSTYCHSASTLKQVTASKPNASYKHYVQVSFVFSFRFLTFFFFFYSAVFLFFVTVQASLTTYTDL